MVEPLAAPLKNKRMMAFREKLQTCESSYLSLLLLQLHIDISQYLCSYFLIMFHFMITSVFFINFVYIEK